ncbi:MAG: ABC transporter permease [Cyanobacteria bacterium P01_A01_bin.84]
MIPAFMDKIGDFNPQLLREIKGRLKVFPIIVAVALSVLLQSVIGLYQVGDLPGEEYSRTGTYCQLAPVYQNKQREISQLNNKYYSLGDQLRRSKSSTSKLNTKLTPSEIKLKREELQSQIKKIESSMPKFCPQNKIDMVRWWLDHWRYVFQVLSVIFIFALLVPGTYLLINDLAKEERRGTLNFIRLSPQSEFTTFTGKMLGVPILAYLFVAAAIPLHIASGMIAQIPLSSIFGYYIILISSCIFFFSAALLFALFGRFFSVFQPWLGSGIVLGFLWLTWGIASTSGSFYHHAAVWLQIFSPFDFTNYILPHLFFNRYNYNGSITDLQFVYLPVGRNFFTLIGIHLLNYGIWTYFFWQGLRRLFRNPNSNILSKNQSYLLVTCLQVLLWGFTFQYTKSRNYNLNEHIGYNLFAIAFFNGVLIFGLIAILTNTRQTVQEWARYRHKDNSHHQGWWKKSILRDLIYGEKSPAILSIGINLITITVPAIAWIIAIPVLGDTKSYSIKWLINDVGRTNSILYVGLSIFLVMICATLAQVMMMLKTKKRVFWAMGSVAAFVFLPPIVLGVLRINPQTTSFPWIISSFPWATMGEASTIMILIGMGFDILLLAVLNRHLFKQVQLAGESEAKTILNN